MVLVIFFVTLSFLVLTCAALFFFGRPVLSQVSARNADEQRERYIQTHGTPDQRARLEALHTRRAELLLGQLELEQARAALATPAVQALLSGGDVDITTLDDALADAARRRQLTTTDAERDLRSSVLS